MRKQIANQDAEIEVAKLQQECDNVVIDVGEKEAQKSENSSGGFELIFWQILNVNAEICDVEKNQRNSNQSCRDFYSPEIIFRPF